MDWWATMREGKLAIHVLCFSVYNVIRLFWTIKGEKNVTKANI